MVLVRRMALFGRGKAVGEKGFCERKGGGKAYMRKKKDDG